MTSNNIYVPNEGSPDAKLWIVGEAPGFYETIDKKPFVGDSGRLLDETLFRHGIDRNSCFITNLCHFQPTGNKFDNLFNTKVRKGKKTTKEKPDYDSPKVELQQGLLELDSLLQRHKPNLIVALGAWPLYYLTEKDGIGDFRGSILSTKYNQKVIATYHPAAILRSPIDYTIFDLDFKRIAEDQHFPELRTPEILYHTDYWNYRDTLCNAEYLAVDIETFVDSFVIRCIGFAYSATEAVVVPHDDSFEAREFIQCIFNSKAKFIYHNGIFDTEEERVNGYSTTDILIANYPTVRHDHDTHIQAHVLDLEMPRSLAHLTSIHTRIPYYKRSGDGEKKGWSPRTTKEELYKYNGLDCCATYEIFFKQQEALKEEGQDSIDTYEFEMQAVELSKHFTINGMLRDPVRHKIIKTYLEKERSAAIFAMYFLVGKQFNLSSPQQVAQVLYEELKLPPRSNRTKDGGSAVTTDDDALISLIAFTKSRKESVKTEKAIAEWDKKFNIVKLLKKIRGLNKLLESYIDINISGDGRVRSLYKPGATETARWSASKYIDDSGLNGQTIPRDALEIPDKLIEEVVASCQT